MAAQTAHRAAPNQLTPKNATVPRTGGTTPRNWRALTVMAAAASAARKARTVTPIGRVGMDAVPPASDAARHPRMAGLQAPPGCAYFRRRARPRRPHQPPVVTLEVDLALKPDAAQRREVVASVIDGVEPDHDQLAQGLLL